jgi:hypothetical protein
MIEPRGFGRERPGARARRQTRGKHGALPGSLATVTSPPIMRASLRVMARPSPVPPNVKFVRALEDVRRRLRCRPGQAARG